jgi:hypothetical protein
MADQHTGGTTMRTELTIESEQTLAADSELISEAAQKIVRIVEDLPERLDDLILPAAEALKKLRSEVRSRQEYPEESLRFL